MNFTKKLEKLRRFPSNFSFKDFESILKNLEFKQVKTNAGSHFKWRNKTKNIVFAAPRKNPMKKIYLKELSKIIKNHFNL